MMCDFPVLPVRYQKLHWIALENSSLFAHNNHRAPETIALTLLGLCFLGAVLSMPDTLESSGPGQLGISSCFSYPFMSLLVISGDDSLPRLCLSLRHFWVPLLMRCCWHLGSEGQGHG